MRLFALICCWLALTGNALGAIAHVVSTAAGSVGGAPVTTGAIDTTGANLIVVSVSFYNTTAPALTDSKGNTWTALTARTTATNPGVRLFYCYNPTVGSGHTFTATQAVSFPTIGVSAFSGVAASPFDQESGASTSGAGTTYQPGSITPSENNCLLVTTVSTNTTTHTINSSFVIGGTVDQSGGNHMGGGIAYKIQTTAGAENPTWSYTASSSRAAAMASFKAAATSVKIAPSYLNSLIQ